MNSKQLVKKLLDEGDRFEGELDYEEDDGFRMKDNKFKGKKNKPKREKPEWKRHEEGGWD